MRYMRACDARSSGWHLRVGCGVLRLQHRRYEYSHQRTRFVYHLAAYAAEGMSHFIRGFNYKNNLVTSATRPRMAFACLLARC